MDCHKKFDQQYIFIQFGFELLFTLVVTNRHFPEETTSKCGFIHSVADSVENPLDGLFKTRDGNEANAEGIFCTCIRASRFQHKIHCFDTAVSG